MDAFNFLLPFPLFYSISAHITHEHFKPTHFEWITKKKKRWELIPPSDRLCVCVCGGLFFSSSMAPVFFNWRFDRSIRVWKPFNEEKKKHVKWDNTFNMLLMYGLLFLPPSSPLFFLFISFSAPFALSMRSDCHRYWSFLLGQNENNI